MCVHIRCHMPHKYDESIINQLWQWQSEIIAHWNESKITLASVKLVWGTAHSRRYAFEVGATEGRGWLYTFTSASHGFIVRALLFLCYRFAQSRHSQHKNVATFWSKYLTQNTHLTPVSKPTLIRGKYTRAPVPVICTILCTIQIILDTANTSVLLLLVAFSPPFLGIIKKRNRETY